MTNEVEQVRATVRERYGRTAARVLQVGATGGGCCGSDSSCCGGTAASSDPITTNLYADSELSEIPSAAVLASLGCGNPTALAELKAGEKVLDLGSGGGIDVLLSARRVGPAGFAYGLDMTDEMLALAERNRAEAGVQNVQFLKGVIEEIPLPDNAVDVVISNCVINLSADKVQVLREAYRVLAARGRFAVSDIVVRGQMPAVLRRNMEAWAGCISGALEEETYRRLLAEAGFTDIDIEVTRTYSLQDVCDCGERGSLEGLTEEESATLEGKLVSAFVRARKPV
jgi:arsenite methyltransferase